MLLEDFFQEDGITRNVLETGEIVTHIQLPENSANFVGSYQKLRLRRRGIFLKEELPFLWEFQMMGLYQQSIWPARDSRASRKHIELIKPR